MKNLTRLVLMSLFLCGAVVLTGCGEKGGTDNGGNAATTETGGAADTGTTDEGSAAKEGDGAANDVNEGEYQLVSLKLPNMT